MQEVGNVYCNSSKSNIEYSVELVSDCRFEPIFRRDASAGVSRGILYFPWCAGINSIVQAGLIAAAYDAVIT